MIRGETKNVALHPVAYKDLDPSETFVPAQIDLRNGRMTDAGFWRKRPGYAEKWDTGSEARVELLIPEDTGYAVLANGYVYSLGENPIRFRDRVTVVSRTSYVKADDTLIVVGGGRLQTLANNKVSELAAAPNGIRFLAYVNARLVGAGYDDTEWRWTNPGDITAWSDANFTNVEADAGRIRNMVALRERLHFFKDHTIEVWDTVGSDAVFSRSFVVEKGTTADYSVVKANNSLYWLGNDGDFYGLGGSEPQVVSKSYRRELDKLTARDDCYGIDFRQENCIRWFFPTHGKCFRFDYLLGAFYEDNAWQSGAWARLPVNAAMYFEGKTYVGDYNPTGKVYHWSDEHASDDGADIRVYRRFLVPLTTTGNRARVNRVQFRVKRGAATTATRRPMFMVRYRMDADNWSDTLDFDLGQKGDWDPYVDISNVGVGRELEMELTETDAVEWLVTHVNVTVRELGA